MWRKVKWALVWAIVLIINDEIKCQRLPFEIMTPSVSVDNGKKKFDELAKIAKVPTDQGSCWKSALENLQVGCKLLNENIQVRMALRFSSCYGEMIGQPPIMCEAQTPVKECLKNLNDNAHATFREYFLHTQDMCFYLSQEIWQEQTNHAVNRLQDAAGEVTMQMLEQKTIQEQIFHSQQESLMVQSNMKKDNEDLYNAVVRVKDVFDDFSETAKEHQLISSEIFDKLSRMQKLVAWIQGEMSLLDMIFFYFAAIVFGYFATATTRTRSARFWLIILFMLSIWSEKALYNYLTKSDYGLSFLPEDVHSFTWMIRKFAAVVATIIVIIAGATYKDIQKINNNMLMNMNFAIEKIVQYIDQAQGTNPGLDLQMFLKNKKNEGDNEESDDDDTYSNYSTDESVDNLDHELKELCDQDENSENVAPSGSAIGRFFSRSDNKTALSPIQHRYNLRERSSAPRENPIVNQESATDFARLVKRKKTTKPAENLNYFSSDDDDV